MRVSNYESYFHFFSSQPITSNRSRELQTGEIPDGDDIFAYDVPPRGRARARGRSRGRGPRGRGRSRSRRDASVDDVCHS